jgi:hypothetical protein
MFNANHLPGVTTFDQLMNASLSIAVVAGTKYDQIVAAVFPKAVKYLIHAADGTCSFISGVECFVEGFPTLAHGSVDAVLDDFYVLQ